MKKTISVLIILGLLLSVLNIGTTVSAIFSDGPLDSTRTCDGGTTTSTNSAPVAADDSVSVNEDTSKTIYVLSNDYDGDGDSLSIVSITISSSHGTATISGSTIVYKPSIDYYGSDSFVYKISDGQGSYDTATVGVTVNSVNDLPVANAGGPYSGDTNKQITFSGSKSSDVDGTITGYIWDFENDGTWDTGWLTTATTTCSYASASNYTIKFKVKDNDGATKTATSSVTIIETTTQDTTESTDSTDSASLDEPTADGGGGTSDSSLDSTESQDGGNLITNDNNNDPIFPDKQEDADVELITPTTFRADAGEPYYGTRGHSVQFAGSDSINAVSYTWDFGDGYTGSGVTPTHIYSESGEYYVTLTVTNNIGSKLMDITPVYISQSGSHLKPYGKRSYGADKYESITFDASKSISTDSSKSIVSYKWYFGDGSTATGQQVTHSYYISKVYLVTLEVTDSQGNKKQDVLHADIGQEFRDIDDFFILSDLSDVVSSLVDLYEFLDVSIYTNFNSIEKETPVRAGTLPVSIDMNNDGSIDVSIGSISLLAVSISKSQFHDLPWFVFTTTLSSVNFLSSGSIGQSDEVTVCLQMSLDKISNLDLAEKRVRVGYHSDAGEAKPTGSFGIEHLFRPYLLLRTWKESHGFYPEVGSSITGSGGANMFSLFTNFADVNNPNIQSTMTLHYDPFIDSTLIHRRGKTSDGLRLYDIAFQGSGQSALRLYFTRENVDGKASVGVLIDPIQNFAFHIDATPLVEGGGSIKFRSDELINNIILFAESDDPQADGNIYFYLKNLPQSFDVEWDPSLKDGFIRASNVQGNDRLEVGICNDLQNPTWKINATNLPSSVDLFWDLSIEGQIQLKSKNTEGIALDYYGWSAGQIINFHVEADNRMDVIASWDLTERWFKVIKSDTRINFDFSIIQPDLTVDLSGELAIPQAGEGITIDFSDFENGFITVYNQISSVEVSVGVSVKYGNLEVGVESLNLGTSGGGSAVISWDDTPRFKVEANLGGTTFLKMSNFKLIFNNLNMAIGTLDLYGSGFAEIQWSEASKTIGISASARLTSTDIVLDYESLHLSAGSFELGGEASASIEIGEGFSVNAGASIQLGNFDLGVGSLDLSIGSLYLDGSGSVSVRKGSLESLILEGSTTFGIGSVSFDYDDLSIKIQGSLDISAGGKVILDRSHLELQGTLTVTIPSQCIFVINSETIKVRGTFRPTSKGSISVSWSGSNSISLGATVSTNIDNFYFEYQTLKATSSNINLNGNGDIHVNLGTTFSASGTISGGFSMSSVVFIVGNDNPRLELAKINLGSSGTVSVISGNTLKIQGDVAFYLEDFYFKSSSVEVRIDGVVDLDAGGHVEVGDNKFEMSVSGAVNLDSTFHVNQKKIAVSGDFNLEGDGTIALNWDTSQKYVELTATGGKLTANGLNFNYDTGAFIVTANKIEFAVGGHCLVSWANDALKVDGGGGAYLKIKDITVEAGSTNIQIIGSLDLDANGYVSVGDNKLELQVDGSISLGSCQFVINGVTITASGDFNLQGSSGKILLTWSSNNVELNIPSGNAPLSVSNLNFVYDPFSISGTGISFQASGRFYAEWNTASNSILIEGSGSADLSLNNVQIKYGTQLDVVISTLSLDAGGYAKFEDGLLELRATGSMNLDTEFILGGQNIKAKGYFDLHGITSTIQLSWDINFIELKTPENGVSLSVTGLDFSYGTDFSITADSISCAANGKFRVDWSTVSSSLDVTGGSASLDVTNVHISYQTSLDIDIDGTLSIQAGGNVFFKDGLLRLSGSTSFDLIGTKITINGEWIKAEGTFSLSASAGAIEFTWDAENVGLKVTGGASLTITNPSLETQKIIVDANSATIGVNGNLDVQVFKASKIFDISGNVDFTLTSAIVKYEGIQIFSSSLVDIIGGGTVHIGDTYSLQLSGFVDIDSLDFNPPALWGWSLDYVQGSFDLSGTGTLTAGQGTLSTDATIQGTIDQFKLYFTTSHMRFTKLTANADVLLDLTDSRFEVKGGGQITLNSFNAEFDQWTANIVKAQGDGYLYINLFYSQQFRVTGNGKFILDQVDVSRGSTFNFYVWYLQSDSGGYCNVDLSIKNIDIHGNGRTLVETLSVTSATGLNVRVPLMDLAGNGKLKADWTSSSLDMDASVDINFRFDINTASYGDWYASGNLDGAINLDASWTTGVSGNAKLTITRAGSMNALTVIHDDLTLTLGNLDLKTGSMTFTWDRGDTGYVQIQNTISATLSSFRLTKGTFDINIGLMTLSSGTGKISWSKTSKEVEIINGILDIKPLTINLDVGDLDVYVSLGNIKKTSQPITIKWFTDATGIIGGGVDTNNQELASLINFKIEQGSKGVQVTIGGLKTNDFEMRKSGGQWQFFGTIQIASSVTVGLKYSGTWHEVVLSWDIQSSTKYIKMQCNFGQDVPIRLFSFKVGDWTFSSTATIDANAYMKLDWHLSSTTNHIRFDTNNKPMGSVTFEATASGMGVRVTASVIKADNAAVTWNQFPPVGITWSGTIDFATLTNVDAKWGSTWYDIYP